MDNEKLWQKLGQVKWTEDDQQNSWRKVTQKVDGHKRRARYKYAISTVGLLALFSIVLWQLLVLPSYESKTQFQQQHTADLFMDAKRKIPSKNGGEGHITKAYSLLHQEGHSRLYRLVVSYKQIKLMLLK